MTGAGLLAPRGLWHTGEAKLKLLVSLVSAPAEPAIIFPHMCVWVELLHLTPFKVRTNIHKLDANEVILGSAELTREGGGSMVCQTMKNPLHVPLSPSSE